MGVKNGTASFFLSKWLIEKTFWIISEKKVKRSFYFKQHTINQILNLIITSGNCTKVCQILKHGFFVSLLLLPCDIGAKFFSSWY